MDLGLITGGLGLAVAAASFGWQIATWAFDGRRVRVALVHGAMGGGGVVIGKVGRDRMPKDLRGVRGEGFLGKEIVGIAVTNVGRAPVRIDRYAVELRRGGLSFRPLADAIGPDLPFRLPPGETETWYAAASDGRALVSSSREVLKRRASCDVRMSVELGTGDLKKTRRSVNLERGAP